MPHYDTFRVQLAVAHPDFGHALWDTSPGEQYPPVEVGDVGFIRQGKFHRLFNALCSENHPSNTRFGVPEDHERLPPVPNHIDRGTLYPNNLCSYGVTVTSGESNVFATGPPAPGSAEVSFSCTRKQGAVLSLPVAAQRVDTLAQAHFRKWIIRHIDSWFAFSQRHGLGIEMEDILLVTGYHRTRSSSNIVFYESRVNARVSFGVQVPGIIGTTVHWQVSSQHIQGAVVNQGPSGENLPENQCIFIRGFRVERTFRIFSKIRAAAEPKPDPSGNDDESETKVVSIPSATDISDPLRVLLEYIAQRMPHCDMALVHDDDLERILGVGDRTSLEALQPDVTMNYLERLKPEIGVMSNSLPASDQSPRADTGHVTVAMLSEHIKSLDPPKLGSLPTHAASRLIHIIREQYGFDDDHSKPSPAVRKLRGKLERALERLSSDLYNKKTHFLLEFIQNADDNAYADDVIPSLNLQIEHNLVVFECNEVGFSADDVKAICDIGQSTKTREKSTRGFIGEKGIGFKSVFTVANEVHISSGPYSFYFDRTAQLGMITPVWGSAYPPRRGWTTFHLRLAPSEKGTDLSAQLTGLRPTLLLFLRQLRVLNVTVPGVARHGALQMLRRDGPGDDLVSLERIDDGELKVERYVLVKHLAQTPAQEPGREGVEQSEIILAFPVTETGEPVIEKQEVHAFLPLRYYGFNFIVQADFITSASREDVLADKEWNRALLRSIIDAFLLAVDRFADHRTLRNVWFRYLPESISDSFFCYVEHKLMTELQHRPILRSSDGTQVRASQLLILPVSFRDDSNAPLIPEAHLPRGLCYLSSDYDAHGRDELILRRLGVREMTNDDFLAGLSKMDGVDLFGAQSAEWHDSVAACLLRLPRTPFGRGVRPEVSLLRILPLRNGSWTTASLASRFMFPPAGVNIPDDLDLQSIAPGIPVFSPRYQLFLRLGVTLPNPATIANKILLAGGPRSVVNRVAHARFFFEHRAASNMPPAARLRLVNERGEGAQGDEMYLDLPGEDGALALRDALSPFVARFLHPDYLSAYPEEAADNETHEDEARADTRSEWVAWLRDSVGVNVVPRVVNGRLTPDFLDRAPKLAGRELLVSLRAWWPRLSTRLTEAGARALGEVPIGGRRLDRLYLRRGALARADQALKLPFVPVDDPEDHGWDFLELLGVGMRLDAVSDGHSAPPIRDQR